jgi:hypothetical protein
MTKAPADVFRLALRAAVRDGYFTSSQASRIARELRLPITDLPGRDVLNIHITDDTWPMIFLELEALVSHGWHSTTRISWKEAAARIAAMKIEELMKLHEDLQTQFEQRQRRLAFLLIGGALSLAAWRYNFWSLTRKLMLSQAALGAGTPPISEELDRLLDLLARESDYVDNFQMGIFAGKVQKATGIEPEKRVPQSEEAIAARGDLYAGTPRGLFAETMEAHQTWEPGYVMHYVPKDDDNTCEPCHDAAGYYLPQSGPYPGIVCEGRGRCRCVRVPVFLPEKYQELTAALS